MNVSQNHHRIPPSEHEKRVAQDWVTRRLRWERMLDDIRDPHGQ